jgi:hypothetical protein
VTVSVPARLTVSPNSRLAVVSGVRGQVAAFALPSGRLVAKRAAADVRAVMLSAGGRAAGLLTTAGELLASEHGDWRAHALGAPVGAAVVLADAADQAAVLVPGRPARIELWRLDGPQSERTATAELPDGNQGALQADGDLGTLVAWLGDAPGGPRPAVLLDSGLQPVEGFPGPEPVASVTAFAGRAWVAGPDGVTAWDGSGAGAVVPGTLRERLAFAPGGELLLLHRADEDLGGGAVRAHLRILRLPSADPVDERDAPLPANTTLVLTDGGDVLAARPDEAGGVALEAV